MKYCGKMTIDIAVALAIFFNVLSSLFSAAGVHRDVVLTPK